MQASTLVGLGARRGLALSTARDVRLEQLPPFHRRCSGQKRISNELEVGTRRIGPVARATVALMSLSAKRKRRRLQAKSCPSRADHQARTKVNEKVLDFVLGGRPKGTVLRTFVWAVEL